MLPNSILVLLILILILMLIIVIIINIRWLLFKWKEKKVLKDAKDTIRNADIMLSNSNNE